MAQRPCIAVLGTCDTKLAETLFLREQILQTGRADVKLLDVGRTAVSNKYIDISSCDLAAIRKSTNSSATPPFPLLQMARTDYIKYMIDCATSAVAGMFEKREIHGIVSAAGSSGTSLVTAVMRNAVPIGFPKFMISTMVSGDVSHLVEETDITLMYSVVDIAGTNSILNQILANAAAAIVGAATAYHHRQSRNDVQSPKNTLEWDVKKRGVVEGRKQRIAITMFGVTTPCVDAIREHLLEPSRDHRADAGAAYEVYVFHATGSGGKAMERLIREKQIDAVLDMTTTEIADEIVGGILSAGPQRLLAAAEAGIPQVISVGACDMVNFGPSESVPAKFRGSGSAEPDTNSNSPFLSHPDSHSHSDSHSRSHSHSAARLLYEHNPAVTLMRTTPEECIHIAEFIATKLRDNATRPDLVKVLLPTGGVSMISSTPDQPFYNPESDAALFDTIEDRLRGSGIEVRRDNRDINDKGFAVLAADTLLDILQGCRG